MESYQDQERFVNKYYMYKYYLLILRSEATKWSNIFRQNLGFRSISYLEQGRNLGVDKTVQETYLAKAVLGASTRKATVAYSKGTVL